MSAEAQAQCFKSMARERTAELGLISRTSLPGEGREEAP
jgi:hypothetical protein